MRQDGLRFERGDVARHSFVSVGVFHDTRFEIGWDSPDGMGWV